MINVTQQCESLNTGAPNIVTAAADTAKDVLPDRRLNQPGFNSKRYAYRSIQNVGAVNLYVAFGVDCSINDARYHLILPPYASWSIYSLERVSVMATGGTAAVATLEIDRPY